VRTDTVVVGVPTQAPPAEPQCNGWNLCCDFVGTEENSGAIRDLTDQCGYVPSDPLAETIGGGCYAGEFFLGGNPAAGGDDEKGKRTNPKKELKSEHEEKL